MLVNLGQSLSCVKFRGSAPPKGRNIISKKSPLGCKFIRVNNFLVYGPKYTNSFRPTWGVVDDQELFPIFDVLILSLRYSPSKSILVKNFEKFWTIFLPSQILGGGHCKYCAHFITPASRDVDGKKSREDTSTSSEVIESNMLNFRPDF